ncbi:methyltransferase domain-containing protein [Agrobacterium bohemicum]|uniref:Methyltransferase type 11 n=1 Tax=Agrobacterium bohemicum TaxID=2052828 RepID=A0A135P7L1_9HYPH|nr:methyltransferase domain-containing protein [Agrobacterium bohemicum]KXG87412.1 methyltransferase type 11 [Agrobacterium bohemicum]
MHDTALENSKYFFETYTPGRSNLKIIEIGSQNVNGTIRVNAPADSEYIGLDFVEGRGVDVVIDDPYVLPVEDEFADVVVSSSCFEHSEFFWLSFNEALRILKSDGLLYINVPSNGGFHRYPVDCWRFYPDSGIALQNWARRCGYNAALLESFITLRKKDQWNDFVAVYVKNEAYVPNYPERIHLRRDDYLNARTYGSNSFTNPSDLTEDQIIAIRRLERLGEISKIASPQISSRY